MSHATPSKPTQPNPDAPQVPAFILADDEGFGSVSVSETSFAAFSAELDDNLAALEEQFAEFQTPQMSSHRQEFKLR